ncbi:MAG: trypsin-like peptidase domain-containing protein [Clostridiales bacterium]|nr:trypsin-like peptidase domain-containing protein [Clostridiales bacterium]MCF8021787.1 trypsin-like peptidase domain-containing protein [Clostridiales bacterium]
MQLKKKNILLISITALIAGIMFMGGCLLVNDLYGQSFPRIEGGNAGAAAVSENASLNSVTSIVESAGPAVVKVNTTKVVNSYYNDSAFRYFFGQELPSQKQKQQGLGSGVIISKEGLVITNQHVIDGATSITVTVGNKEKNKKEYSAEVVGSDYDLDLSLLKIKQAENLTYLKLANSNNVRVGDRVVAIGNPYGFDHTVTAGVISAKGRPITVEDRQYKDLVQTDAAINPGNSGGPLLNANGQVIGINTAVANAQGIGFAIPSNTVKNALDELKEKGKVSHPWLGVQMTDLTQKWANYFGLETGSGVVIMGVIPGSPAKKAGLKQGDIILEIDGNKVENAESLAESIKKMKIGQKGQLLVYRDGRLLNIEFAVEEKPAQYK